MSTGLDFVPLLPTGFIFAGALIGLVMVAIAAVRRGKGWVLRALVLGVLVLALLNPRVVREERTPETDVAVVVVDRSLSQSVGSRATQTDATVDRVRSALAGHDGLEPRLVEVGPDRAAGGRGGTLLVAALERALGEIPARRLAGAVLITDGQIHDVPATGERSYPAPVHVLLTGERDEADRRIVVERSPGYGIVGHDVSLVYRIEDREDEAGVNSRVAPARVVLRRDDGAEESRLAPVGKRVTASFTLEHAGATLVELEVEAVDGELSTINNRALVSINGVRDRLRVLLVSGQPHAGERTWRNLLKSDPSVDLVHFTILRPPEKDDFTPLRELALIAFPVQELFEEKLGEFDLIVFDRYVVRDVLPPSYLRNIGDYVTGGGAVLLAVGPEFAGVRSLFRTPLGTIMPAVPTGEVLELGFRPGLTAAGKRHPVTAALPDAGVGGEDEGKPEWGRWFRQVDARTRSGSVVMEGVDGRPLLLLDRVGKGRIALLMSDHMWLWARGFEGGGPQAELLRRLAHWLMKEPELEEDRLSARVNGTQLAIERRSLTGDFPEIRVTDPSGRERTVSLVSSTPAETGLAKAVLPIDEPGLYRISDGVRTVLAAAGALNPLEFKDLRATATVLTPLAEATGGGVHWIVDGVPEVRRVQRGRDTAGSGWIGFRQNHAFVVSGVSQVSLLPGLLLVAVLLAMLMGAWWRESR